MGGFRTLIIAAASAVALGGASMAAAQSAPTPAAADQAPVDPARLAQARQLLQMQMGQMDLSGLIRSMDRQVFAAAAKNAPDMDAAKQKRINDAVEKVQAEMLPKMMDDMAKAFARNLTQKEMDDSLAFYSSPSGQAILHKMPMIMTQAIGSLTDYIPRLQKAVIEAVCADNGCTAAQREAMEHPKPPGAKPPG